MTKPSPESSGLDPVRWLNHQPYLLLSLASLFWAGNIVLGRYVAGHVPPITLTCVRWIGAFFTLLPFARPHLAKDWLVLRAHLPLVVGLSATGFALNNVMSYWALQHTEALNALLIQSSGPLFVAMWALILFGVRLTFGNYVASRFRFSACSPSSCAANFRRSPASISMSEISCSPGRSSRLAYILPF
jgi:threonine/homoserine efflux transporter RhtA